METMSEIELIKFEKHKEDLRKRVANNWQSTFEKQSRWSQPHIVNGEYAPEQAFNQLWVISRILPVGQHDFIVRSRKNDSTEYEWSIFNTMVDIRLEPIPVSKHHTANICPYSDEEITEKGEQAAVRKGEFCFCGLERGHGRHAQRMYRARRQRLAHLRKQDHQI
jgi:hypothetical protein